MDTEGNQILGANFSVGSGSVYAYGVMAQDYSYNLEMEQAYDPAHKVSYQATCIDAFSGGKENAAKSEGSRMAGMGLVAGEVVVDALPYFDQGYEAPGVREAAAALVEEETRRYRPTKNYLSYLTAPDYSAFETDIMRNEFERLAARQPIELLSMKR
ncbi:hypothetical protein P7K49_036299 [Saguinus oedipus]|uniref:Pre-mRNA-splicing factor SPF27 n=1 Tax=Saguinus oedipus TaxID=9490 RepID=A0ABQ9TJV7_SAGOE|nr:hypothetical protein P7K49_036299 [Saguinus oedipus]